jgi:phosphoesterase RecJ-like protein
MENRLVAAIEAAERIALVSHVRPDGDAAGSLYGLHHALKSLNKRVISVLQDGVPVAFQFLKGLNPPVQNTLPEDCDLCIVLDCSDSGRTGFPSSIDAYAKRGQLAVIDHHPAGNLLKLTDFSLYDQTASSASELVYRLIMQLGVKLDSSIATPLLTGIYTDTGGFQYSNTVPRTLEVAGELMKRGARLQHIIRNLTRNRSLPSLRLLGIALERLSLVQGTRPYAMSVLTLDDFVTEQASTEDIQGIANNLNSLSDTDFVFLVYESEPGIVRGTMRTAEGCRYDVRPLAQLLGGGGHPKASGFQMPGQIVSTSGGWQIVAPR